MALKFNISVAKRLKLKVKKLWGLIPTFAEVTGEKLIEGEGRGDNPLSRIGLIYCEAFVKFSILFQTPWTTHFSISSVDGATFYKIEISEEN